jgi:hypothetical protein
MTLAKARTSFTYAAPIRSLDVHKILAQTNLDLAQSLLGTIRMEMQHNRKVDVTGFRPDMEIVDRLISDANTYLDVAAEFEQRNNLSLFLMG